MKTTNAATNFSTLKMKDEIQAKIYEEIKNMTGEELLTYFAKRVQSNPTWSKLTEDTTSNSFLPTRKKKGLAQPSNK